MGSPIKRTISFFLCQFQKCYLTFATFATYNEFKSIGISIGMLNGVQRIAWFTFI